jgi:hypothetical protein
MAIGRKSTSSITVGTEEAYLSMRLNRRPPPVDSQVCPDLSHEDDPNIVERGGIRTLRSRGVFPKMYDIQRDVKHQGYGSNRQV